MGTRATSRPTSPGGRGEARRHADRAGRRADTLCAWLLRLKGYRLLARRHRTPFGELDIVARRGGTLVAVEVKVRDTLADAALSVTPRQRRRIAHALDAYRARHPAVQQLAVRFDAMLVVAWRVHHVRDAWRPEA